MLNHRILAVLSLAIFIFSWWGEKICVAENAASQEKPARVSPKIGGKLASISPNGTNIHSQLKRVVNLSGFTLDTSFGEAIEILRHSTEPSLNIVVLWRDLRENAFIDASTPIQIEGVSGIPLHFGLELLLRAVSSRRALIGYVVENGIIIIGTSQSLPTKMTTHVYDITDVTAGSVLFGFNRPTFGGFGYGSNFMQNQWTGPIQGRTYRRSLRDGARDSGAYNRPIRRPAVNTPTGRLTPYPRADRASEMTRLIKNTIEPDSWDNSQ